MPNQDSSASSCPAPRATPNRREVLGGAAAAAALWSCAPLSAAEGVGATRSELSPAPAVLRGAGSRSPVLVGSANGLKGMHLAWQRFADGGAPLDAAIEVVKVQEADPEDMSVGLGGLPNEAGVVTLDAACMHGPTHNSGAVAAIENILHPCEVARLVMERTDHCLLVARGAYDFARAHGHAHTELLTEKARQVWLAWKESLSDQDDWLEPAAAPADRQARFEERLRAAGAGHLAFDWSLGKPKLWGTIHVSALSGAGELACCTTTSGLAFKIPGRVGDSAIVGAGLYCDQEAGSAGSTGRGEASILANGSFAIVELLRAGRSPLEAGMDVLRRIQRQTERQAKWQPALLGSDGLPAFNVQYYIIDERGRYAGVGLKKGGEFAVAEGSKGPRLEPIEGLL